MPSINSKKLIIFYFVLSVLVILVHSLSNVAFLKDFVTIYIQPISIVPFFILSGFLFFRNIYNMQDVVRKISNRIHTLLVPYILWNIVYYVIYVVCKKDIYFSIFGLIDAMMSYKYNPTFWFLYQLIILTLITPVIFYLIKEKKVAIVTFIAAFLLMFIGGDVPYLNEDAFVYYFLGAYVAKYHNRLFYDMKVKNMLWTAFVLSIGGFFIFTALIKLSIYSVYIYNLSVIITVCQRICVAIVMYTVIDYICRYQKVPVYMKHSFFIYAIHYIIIRIISSVTKYFTIFYMNEMMQNIVEVVVFTITPIIVVYISHYLYKFLYKKCNKALMLLTGGR